MNAASADQGRLKGALPQKGRLAGDEITVFARFGKLFDLRDAVVVEIGGALPAGLVRDAGVRRWHAVDPRDFGDRIGDLPVVRHHVPILDFALPEGRCDLFFSSNAFQHVHRFREMLDHLATMAKPGAWLYANFGPIWSAPDGSHIENLKCRGKTYQFWNGPLHPAWAHLHYEPRELLDLLTPEHGEQLANELVTYIQKSAWINRMTLLDYESAVHDSMWQLMACLGCAEFGYSYLPGFPKEADYAILRAIAARAQAETSSFFIRDLELILRSPL